MPSIVIVEQYFYPEGWGGAQLPRDIAVKLARDNYSVKVLCGSDQYVTVTPDDEIEDPRHVGVSILKIPRIVGGSAHAYKIVKQIWFHIVATVLLTFNLRTDIYLAFTNPPLIVVIVAIVASLFNKPFIIVAQDIYPEILNAGKKLHRRSLFYQILDKVITKAYRCAASIVVLGPEMKIKLQGKGISPDRIFIISNWATGNLRIVKHDHQLKKEWRLKNCFTLLYSGNLGLGHEFGTIFTAIKELKEQGYSIQVVIIGNGRRLIEVKQLASEYKLADLLVTKPFQRSKDLPYTLGLADMALVTIQPGFEGLIVPSKLFGYMARGIPTLYIGNKSDISYYINTSKGGIECVSGDTDYLKECLLRLIEDPQVLNAMGNNAKEYYFKHLASSLALNKYISLISSVLDESLCKR